MNRLLRSLFSVTYPYSNSLLRQRAVSLLIIIWASGAGWALYTFGVAVPNISQGSDPGTYLTVGFAVVPFLAVFSLVALQRGLLSLSAFLIVGALMLATLPLLYSSPEGMLPLGALVPLVAGGVLLRRRTFLIVAGIILASLIGRALWLSGITEPYLYVPANNVDLLLLVPLVTFGVAAVFLATFSSSAERLMADAVSESGFLHSVAQHSVALDRATTETEVLTNLVRNVQDSFGFFNVQLYMARDDGQLLRRVRMALDMADTSASAPPPIVVSAAQDRNVVIVDRQSDAARRRLLTPPSRKTIALPLIDNDRVMGVIEAQSDSDRPFSNAQIDALSLLVEQTARVLALSRRLDDAETALTESRRNVQRLSDQLSAQERQGTQSLRMGWESYLQKRGAVVGFDLESEASESLLRADDMPPQLRKAMERGQTVLESTPEGQVLNVPIVFRGELLGAMSFALSNDRPLTERQIELARNVAERLGSALENSRLFEQSQAQAQRERQAGETTSRLLGITDVQTVLDLAASEFQAALGAVYARIYLNTAAPAESVRSPQEAS